METPIYDFLTDFAEGETARFFMPGHKGDYPFELLKQISKYDITEIDGADSLFHADGIIARSEENAARLFGAENTCYSAGGSTLCIQAMLALAVSRSACGEHIIIAARNAHTAFVNGCALLGITPRWVLPEYNDSAGISGEVTADSIERALDTAPSADAVYITSPDYLGCVSDVKAIAELCKARGVPLLVDNAHGAHLKFTAEDRHPMTLGASLCCDSAHKTLPALTGGAYLHSAKNSGFKKAEMKAKMSLFGSTSPSYLIMMSLDLCNRYLSEDGKAEFAALEKTAEKFWAAAAKKGFKPICENGDITKITLDAYAVGYSGNELADYFRKNGIECEYSASRHVVFMISPQNSGAEITRLIKAVEELPAKAPIEGECAAAVLPRAAMPPRNAVTARQEQVEIDGAVGKIAAQTVIKCPPGVPLIVPGEIIDVKFQKFLKNCGVRSLNVIE